MKKKRSKLTVIIIAILILVVVLFFLRNCKNEPPQPQPFPSPDSEVSYYAIDIETIAQKYQKSCWIASLEMEGTFAKDSINKENTTSIYTDSIAKHLKTKTLHSFENKNQISWTKLKAALQKDEKMVVYKYFSDDNAHVFVPRGFQESGGSQWVIVNDPWPENKGKVATISFNQFINTYEGGNTYGEGENTFTQIKESTFNIFSSNDLIEDQIGTTYTPPSIEVSEKKIKRISKIKLDGLIDQQIELFQTFDKDLFEVMKLDYSPEEDYLEKDLKSTLWVHLKKSKAEFESYDLGNSIKRNDYLFDNGQIAYINANKKDGTPLINILVHLEASETPKYLYVSRFEDYNTSTRKTWDNVIKDWEEALKIPWFYKLLQNLKNQSFSTRSSSSSQNLQFSADSLQDVSTLNLSGGMIFSFTLPGYDDKIVADPYRQVNLKPGKKALFRGASGTYYYRLSDIDIPDRETFVNRERPIEEEWRKEEIKDPDIGNNPNGQGGNDPKDPNQNDDGTGTGSTKDPKGKGDPIPIGKPNNDGTKPIKVDPNIEKRPRKVPNQELKSPVKAIPKVKEERKRQ